MRMRIGITCDLKPGLRQAGDGRLVTLSPDFPNCILSAGGVPLLLPPLAPGRIVDGQAIESQLDLLDGLILSGGNDMHPRAFGQELNPRTVLQDPERDLSDHALVAAALRRDIPILGICAGMQLITVALGGTLHQHLADLQLSSHPDLHPIHLAQETAEQVHGVELERSTRLLDLMGPEPLETNSRHHQGVDEVPQGLLISARAEDGIIEGLEAAGERFLVAVQWHPEEHLGEARHLRLFEALVRAARNRTGVPGNR